MVVWLMSLSTFWRCQGEETWVLSPQPHGHLGQRPSDCGRGWWGLGGGRALRRKPPTPSWLEPGCPKRPSKSRWHRGQGCEAGWDSQPSSPRSHSGQRRLPGSRQGAQGCHLEAPTPLHPDALWDSRHKEGGQTSPSPSVTRVTAAPRGPAPFPLHRAGRKSSRGSRADIKPSHRRPGRSPSLGPNEAINPH